METGTVKHVLIERLSPESYSELEKVEEGYRPDPENSIVIVARNGTEIIGRTMMIRPFHVEGTWIHPQFRHGTTGIRMMRKLEEEAKKAGLTWMIAYAADPKIENYIERLGYSKSPLTVWVKEI